MTHTATSPRTASISAEDRAFDIRAKKIELGRRSLWYQCRAIHGDFYTGDRWHLRLLADTLEKLLRGELIRPDTGTPYKKLILEMPPQHGKSRTLINFCCFAYGENIAEKIILGSYNDTTAGDFSRYTRDEIIRRRTDPLDIVYNDIRPSVTLEGGNKSVQRWALKGQHFSYLGAGIGGSVTSKGATILLVDDPIKNAMEALNEDHLQKIWVWYTSTLLSRVSAVGGHPIEILIMTPWAKNDLGGRLLSSEFANEYYVLSLPARDPSRKDQLMLCPSLLSEERYYFLKGVMVPEIFAANYDMERVDVKGKLYKSLKIYAPEDRPKEFDTIRAYVDVADQGDDFLCAVIYGIYDKECYIIDVLHTKEGQDITEKSLAEMLTKNNVDLAKIESNSGGYAFARHVKDKMLAAPLKNSSTVVKRFHQSKNKKARILSSSAWVQEHIYFPHNWKIRWPLFFDHVTNYLKEGKKQPDDAADVLAGVYENHKSGMKWNS